jgi:hypothetical protein
MLPFPDPLLCPVLDVGVVPIPLPNDIPSPGASSEFGADSYGSLSSFSWSLSPAASVSARSESPPDLTLNNTGFEMALLRILGDFLLLPSEKLRTADLRLLKNAAFVVRFAGGEPGTRTEGRPIPRSA